MIRFEQKGRAAYLTLERPPLNILNLEMLGRINQMFDEIRADDRSDVLVFQTALPKAFSAGADVADHGPDNVHNMLNAIHRLLRFLDRSRMVSVAAVQGLCLGGGAELALGCDLVLASEEAEFGFPEIDVGCFPPAAVATLPNRVGRQMANEMVLTGSAILPETCTPAV